MRPLLLAVLLLVGCKFQVTIDLDGPPAAAEVPAEHTPSW